MVVEALRGYLQLASGLTEVTRARAREAARALVAQAEALTGRQGDTAAQVKSLAEDLATTARSNRDLLISIVRAEVDRAVASLGVATRDDIADLRRRLAKLEGSSASTTPLTASSGSGPAARQATATRATASRATASSATASRATASKAAAGTGPVAAATKAASRGTPAKATAKTTSTKAAAPARVRRPPAGQSGTTA